MYSLFTSACKKTWNVNKWNISFASQLQECYWYFQRQNQISLLIIASNLDVCVWGQNVPVPFTFIILLTYVDEGSKLINRSKGLGFSVCLEHQAHQAPEVKRTESMNKIIAKKVCWVVWGLFSLLNKGVDFQTSLTVAEGNMHGGLNTLLQTLSAHNLCE